MTMDYVVKHIMIKREIDVDIIGLSRLKRGRIVTETAVKGRG